MLRCHGDFMDGDVFGKVWRIGRATADAIMLALDGGPWDPFCSAKCADLIFAKAGGVPSLAGVLRTVETVTEAPLLARSMAEGACGEINALVRGADCGVLDLMLGAAAQRSLLRGEHDGREIVSSFVRDVLDRAVLFGQGGAIEHHDRSSLQAAREYLAPVAADAASVLLSRPHAQRLGLARRLPRVTARTNLLGGA